MAVHRDDHVALAQPGLPGSTAGGHLEHLYAPLFAQRVIGAEIAQHGTGQLAAEPVALGAGLPGQGNGGLHRLRPAVPDQFQLDIGTCAQDTDGVAQGAAILDLATVDPDDDVARADARFLRGRPRQHLGHHGTPMMLESEGLCQVPCQILHHHAQLSTLHLAVPGQLGGDRLDHVGRDGETDSHVPGSSDDGGIDTNELAPGGHQCAPGITGVDGGIGLDEVLVALDAEVGTSQGTDDAVGHRLAQAEGIADGHHKITHFQAFRVGQGQLGELVALDLQQGDVHGRVGSEQFRLEAALIAQGHGDLIGILDDMVVGDHPALPRIHDHPGTETLGAFDRRLALPSEEGIEGVVRQTLPIGNIGGGGDVDHRRQHLLEHGRQGIPGHTGRRSPCRTEEEGQQQDQQYLAFNAQERAFALHRYLLGYEPSTASRGCSDSPGIFLPL